MRIPTHWLFRLCKLFKRCLLMRYETVWWIRIIGLLRIVWRLWYMMFIIRVFLVHWLLIIKRWIWIRPFIHRHTHLIFLLELYYSMQFTLEVFVFQNDNSYHRF